MFSTRQRAGIEVDRRQHAATEHATPQTCVAPARSAGQPTLPLPLAFQNRAVDDLKKKKSRPCRLTPVPRDDQQQTPIRTNMTNIMNRALRPVSRRPRTSFAEIRLQHGWPAFFEAVVEMTERDVTLGMVRVEVRSAGGDSHRPRLQLATRTGGRPAAVTPPACVSPAMEMGAELSEAIWIRWMGHKRSNGCAPQKPKPYLRNGPHDCLCHRRRG
jgi:hypothetical protein